jgi:hypothetical protein
MLHGLISRFVVPMLQGLPFWSQETAAVMAGDGGDGGLLNSNISHQVGHRNWIMDLRNMAARSPLNRC